MYLRIHVSCQNGGKGPASQLPWVSLKIACVMEKETVTLSLSKSVHTHSSKRNKTSLANVLTMSFSHGMLYKKMSQTTAKLAWPVICTCTTSNALLSCGNKFKISNLLTWSCPDFWHWNNSLYTKYYIHQTLLILRLKGVASEPRSIGLTFLAISWMFPCISGCVSDSPICLFTIGDPWVSSSLKKLSEKSLTIGRNCSRKESIFVSDSYIKENNWLILPYGSGPGLMVSITDRGMV